MPACPAEPLRRQIPARRAFYSPFAVSFLSRFSVAGGNACSEYIQFWAARLSIPRSFSPNSRSVTIWVQVSVLETSRIFQAESQHPVETNVSDPDEGERKNRQAIRGGGENSKR